MHGEGPLTEDLVEFNWRMIGYPDLWEDGGQITKEDQRRHEADLLGIQERTDAMEEAAQEKEILGLFGAVEKLGYPEVSFLVKIILDALVDVGTGLEDRSEGR